MKELIHEVKETYAWEANDGKIFYDHNECLQYEKTAKCAITARLRELFVGGNDPMTEYQIFEGYGGGSEDYLMAVLKIKNEDDLYAVNQYAAMVDASPIPSWYVGQKILVGFGYEYDYLYNFGTYQEVTDKFCRHMHGIFGMNEEDFIDQ